VSARYFVRNELGLWCINDRETGHRVAVAFTRRIAYLIHRHLCEMLP
jgi:hypothetical protein